MKKFITLFEKRNGFEDIEPKTRKVIHLLYHYANACETDNTWFFDYHENSSKLKAVFETLVGITRSMDTLQTDCHDFCLAALQELVDNKTYKDISTGAIFMLQPFQGYKVVHKNEIAQVFDILADTISEKKASLKVA